MLDGWMVVGPARVLMVALYCFCTPLLWTLALQETQFGRGELEAPAVAGFALSEGGQCRSSGSEE